CLPSGQAYALAVLRQLDKSAFQSLTNAFCQLNEDIHVASGCIGWTEKRTELVLQMQRPNSVLAFHLSNVPYRKFSMSFRGDHRDVYEEGRKYNQEHEASAARALAALQESQL